jgi:hypothetical protein
MSILTEKRAMIQGLVGEQDEFNIALPPEAEFLNIVKLSR